MTSKRIALATALLMLFAALSATVQEATARTAPNGVVSATVRQHVMCREIDTSQKVWQPIGITEAFFTTDEKAVSLLHLENVTPPLTIQFTWILPDGTSMKANPVRITEPQDPVIAYSSMKIKGYSWPIGTWGVEAHADGTLLSTIQFKLAPPPLIQIVRAEWSVDGRKVEAGKPIYIGEVIFVSIDLRNNGQETGRAIRIAIEDFARKDIISVVDSTPEKDLPAGAGDTWTVRMRAEKAGTTSGKARIYTAGQKIHEEYIMLVISGPGVELVKVTLSPEDGVAVYPNDILTVTYELKNNRETTAKNVRVTLETPMSKNVYLLELTPAKDIEPGSTESFVIKLRANTEGSYSGKVLFYGGEVVIHEATWSLNVSPLPFWRNPVLMGGAITLVATTVAVIFLIMKRRPASPPAVPTYPTPYPPAQPSPPATVEMKYCMNCGAVMPAEARYCRTCGAAKE